MGRKSLDRLRGPTVCSRSSGRFPVVKAGAQVLVRALAGRAAVLALGEVAGVDQDVAAVGERDQRRQRLFNRDERVQPHPKPIRQDHVPAHREPDNGARPVEQRPAAGKPELFALAALSGHRNCTGHG